MILADNIGQLVRAQLIGKRPRRVMFEARGREQAGSFLFGTRAHPENITEIRCPPRISVMRH
jgi:hypothetical protein